MSPKIEMSDPKRYIIRDPRPMREANPWTFYIPCEARTAAVASGDFVQVVFDPAEEGNTTERMWIEVTGCNDNTLIGTLANQPNFLPMSYGEEVAFERHAIIAIQTNREDDPEETNVLDDEVFHRCWIDQRLLNGEVPAIRATNGHPEPEGYDGGKMNFPWGGWMIVGEGWKNDMPMTIGTPVIVIRQDAAIAPHLLGINDLAIVEKIDGEWKSRRA